MLYNKNKIFSEKLDYYEKEITKLFESQFEEKIQCAEQIIKETDVFDLYYTKQNSNNSIESINFYLLVIFFNLKKSLFKYFQVLRNKRLRI